VRLRPYEYLLALYFTYVATIAPFSISGNKRWLPTLIAAIVIAILLTLSRRESQLRDWIPLAYTFTAFREMNLFTPSIRDHHLENSWIGYDRWLLDSAHLRATFESLGPLLPSYLEVCYVLVYAVAPISLLILILNHRRDRFPTFWFAYLAGTLASYALFPYFPSDPPRTVFAGSDLPHILTVFRRFNLAILGQYGIHSSVFPSAHVSSAFACAWGLFITMPDRRRYGAMVAIFAFSVAMATIYGRYHFAVDALAGFAISFAAFSASALDRAPTEPRQ